MKACKVKGVDLEVMRLLKGRIRLCPVAAFLIPRTPRLAAFIVRVRPAQSDCVPVGLASNWRTTAPTFNHRIKPQIRPQNGPRGPRQTHLHPPKKIIRRDCVVCFCRNDAALFWEDRCSDY